MAHGVGSLLLTCEHARNLVPQGVELGVDREVLESHVSFDRGALEVTRLVAGATGVQHLGGSWSRLVVDLNRSPRAREAVAPVSFGVDIPGNRLLSPRDRRRRLLSWHLPFRRRVLGAVRHRVDRSGRCLHWSIHTFTDRLGEEVRDYDLGILFDPSRPAEVQAARMLVPELQAHGYPTRENEPYPGVADGMTTWLRTRYGDSQYAGLEVEISSRVVGREGTRGLSLLLARLATPCLARTFRRS